MANEYDYLFGESETPQETKIVPIEGQKNSKSDSDYLFDDPVSYEIEKEPPSISEQLKIAPLLFAREGAASTYSVPSTTAELYRFLAGKLQSFGEEQAEKEGRIISDEERQYTNNVVNYIPDLIKSAGEKFPSIFPTYQEAKEKIGSKIEENRGVNLPEHGRGAIERGAIGAAKGAQILAFPGSAAVKAAAIGTTAATEALDLPEGTKTIANLSIPAIASLIESIATRRYIPPAGQAEAIYNRAIQAGYTAEELAPILATEGQIARHGGFAAGVRNTREAFNATHEVLGNAIENLQTRPSAQVHLNATAENHLVNRLNQEIAHIRRGTHALNPQQQRLVDFLETSVTDIANSGSTPRQLIGVWRGINGIQSGRTALARVKPILAEGIESVSPQLAEELAVSNNLYGRFSRNLEQINPTAFNSFVDAGDFQNLMGAVFSGDARVLKQSILRSVSKKAIKHISSSILVNPTAQSLVRNFGRAVRDGRQASARSVGVQLKDYVKKNLPEDYKEIDWKELGIED